MSLVSKLLLQISLMFVISAVAFGQNSKNEAKKLFDAGGVHLSKGQLEEAIKCYTESIKLDPSSHGGYDMRAYAFDRAGKPDQAIADRTIVLEFFLLEKPQKPFAVSRILVNRGLSYTDIGKHTEARNDYTKAINFTPDDANPYMCRGLSYYSTSKFDEAISDLTKAIDLSGKVYKGITELYYRGKSYLALDKKDEGLADLAKAKLIDPKYFSDLELGESKRSANKSNMVAPKVEIINLDKDVKLEMVLIPAGKLMMGFTEKDLAELKIEIQEDLEKAFKKKLGKEETEAVNLIMNLQGKQHEVTLTKPFYMGKHEVTQEQWESVMKKNPSDTKGAKLPVMDVSWNDCQEFIKKLNAKTDGGYRLPTESEWEYSCRAGTSTAYSFGDKITRKDANYRDSKIGQLEAAGSYMPNAFGLYDMHGNVWEWCEDWHGEYPFAVTNPKGPATGKYRVLRGGSFDLGGSLARSSIRNNSAPAIRDFNNGFRLARTADFKPDPANVIPAASNLLVAPFTEAKVKEVQKEIANSLKKEVEEKADLGKGVKLEMVLIPAGKFMMGSPESEKGRDDDEKQHEVTLTKPFYMGKYEVTQEQWEAVMGNNPSNTKSAKLPVTGVSWEDCHEFIKKLNAKTNGGYRLPTEAEWEYACRAGTTTAWSFGEKISITDANITISDSDEIALVLVGSYKANAFGLYDMHGNVWEFCEDWFGDYPAGVVTDPRGAAKGERRILRGGAYIFNRNGVRSSKRYRTEPGEHISLRFGTKPEDFFSFNGFRLAKTADIKASVASPTETKPDPANVIPAAGNLLVAPFTEAKAKEVQKEIANSLKKEVEEKADLGKGVKLEMVLIPAGKFMMGFKELEDFKVALQEDIKKVFKKELGKEAIDNVDLVTSCQGKQHEVTLTKPFYMGKYEVTQEQWEAVMGNNPSDTKGVKLPVTDVSWNDCQEFIKKLNAKTKGGYRLPTEAEWEYACRAGTTTAYSYEDKITPKDANSADSKLRKPVAVGSYKPNAFGLHDMHGNVWEWCEDWHGEYPFAVTNPKGPLTGKYRVLRGGSFYFVVSFARSSLRYLNSPSIRDSNLGFRLVRTVDVEAAVAPAIPNPKPAEIISVVGNLLLAPFTEAKAKEVQKEVAKSLQKKVEELEDLGKGIKLDLVLIPAGKFMMGSPVTEQGRSDNEMQHEVTLTKPFYMGKYEVTQEQWESVMGNNRRSIRTKGAKYPVTNVSWNDCQEFIKKLNSKTNGGYRLPTEAEWEYACRAGTSAGFSFGDKITPKDANYTDSKIISPEVVGNYKPNAFGLYDMHGNMYEWCEDWYGDYPTGAVIDPMGPATGDRRAVRGGYFNIHASNARSSYRNSGAPDAGFSLYGFRLAKTSDIKTGASLTVPKPDSTGVKPAAGNLLVTPFTDTKAKESQKEVAKSFNKEVEELEDLGKGINLDLVLIPAGQFMLGSPESEKGRSGNEKQHQVTLTKSFYMGKYEVTQEQWESVMGSNPSSRTKGAQLPVTDVSWEDCQDFIKKLNAKTKGGYRLPTEAEWEYACRAGTTTAYAVGNSLSKSDANIVGDSIKAVGSYKANAFGLYDMHGNVLEWCEDWYDDYSTKPVKDPKGPATGEYSVLRGGSFYDLYESRARSSNRIGLTPADRTYYFGFRLAKTP